MRKPGCLARIAQTRKLQYTDKQDFATGGMMSEDTVSIGQVKRDISDLVNRVAYRGDRILLTSRGKPKAVLISVADYERLKRQESDPQLTYWNQWLLRAEDLSLAIRERRHGEYVAIDALEQVEESELDRRDDEHLAE